MPQPAVAEVFSPRTARGLGALALLSLLASFYLLLVPGETSRVRSVGADGYSRSAIGHLGLLNLLRDVGEPVLQVRHQYELEDCGLLVLAEPRDIRKEDRTRLRTWVNQAPATLLVLPKRRPGRTDPEAPDWVASVEDVPLEQVTEVLEELEQWTARAAATAVRTPATNWRSEHGWPAPQFGEPGGAEPVQLLDASSARIESLLECDQGVLLGRIGNVHVLSDPDLLANHGLHRGDNAELVVAMLRQLRQRSTIVFDETLHGHRMEPSIWKAAGRFPLVLVPAHLLLMLAFTLWIASGRFGSPLPERPAIGGGKRFLIDNIAALLRRGGHHGPTLRRYGRLRVRHAAEGLHAPRGLSDDQCRDWLLARVLDPAVREELAALLERTTAVLPPQKAVQTAKRIRELTEEMLHAVH